MADSGGPPLDGAQPSKKPRRDSTPVPSQPSPLCILHVPGLKAEKYGKIRTISSLEDGENILAKLKDIKRRRLAEALNSPNRMTDVCNQIPDELSANEGYHRECYKRFTMNLSRLTLPVDESPSTSRPSRKSGDSIIFAPECIFCDSGTRKKIKVKGCWTTEGLSGFEFGGWQDVIKDADQRGDTKLLTRIRGKDLFACEAKYHRSCRKAYHVQDPQTWQSKNVERIESQKALEEAHSFAFNKICEAINDEVLTKNRMMKLGDLRKLYISHLENTDYPNPEYRGSKLKNKLENHPRYATSLSYCPINDDGPQYHGYIVYSSWHKYWRSYSESIHTWLIQHHKTVGGSCPWCHSPLFQRS